MNIGQVLETHLGWAALNGWEDAWDEVGENSLGRQRHDLRRPPRCSTVPSLEQVDDVLKTAIDARAKRVRDERIGDNDVRVHDAAVTTRRPSGRRWSGKLRAVQRSHR